MMVNSIPFFIPDYPNYLLINGSKSPVGTCLAWALHFQFQHVQQKEIEHADNHQNDLGVGYRQA